MKLARAARRLNGAVAMPALVLMTDDVRLADPLRALQVLPRSSMAIVRSADAKRRADLLFAMKPLARLRGVALLVADDPELARYADGLHLPERRAREASHWRALHPRWIVTASAHSLAACARAASAHAIFLSPVFATASHEGRPFLTAARARLIARHLPVPVYALGGVDARNAEILTGFHGVAAISAFV